MFFVLTIPGKQKEKFHIPESITYRLLGAGVGQTECVSLLYFTLDVLKAMYDFFQAIYPENMSFVHHELIVIYKKYSILFYYKYSHLNVVAQMMSKSDWCNCFIYSYLHNKQ